MSNVYRRLFEAPYLIRSPEVPATFADLELPPGVDEHPATHPMKTLKQRICQPRYVLHRRVHHGAAGLALILAGVLLCADDRSDWRDWVPALWNDRLR